MIVSKRRAAPMLGVAGLLALYALPTQAQNFSITNLVSDGSVPAVTVDPSLINPWGMSYAPTGPFWVSDNNANVSTLYDGTGSKVSLTVTIPPPAGTTIPSAPTGQVYNASSTAFKVTSGGKTGVSAFIFDTEDGTISGWAPSVDATNAILAVDNSKQLAVYKGLAIATKKGKLYLYATNFRAGDVEMYDSTFKLVKTFTDTTVPRGYAPYNIQNLGGTLYVTFAKQNKKKHDSVSGAGFGYVDAFTPGGVMLRRVTSKGPLNAPWGLEIAPTSFGAFAGALLVGNFGDGWINAFDPTTGAYKGPLTDSTGAPIAIQDLWGLLIGNNSAGSSSSTVYFTAGLQGQAHGLFGAIAPIAGTTTTKPEPR